MANKILHDVVKDAIYVICISNCVDPHSYILSSYSEWIWNPEHCFQQQISSYLVDDFENITTGNEIIIITVTTIIIIWQSSPSSVGRKQSSCCQPPTIAAPNTVPPDKLRRKTKVNRLS